METRLTVQERKELARKKNWKKKKFHIIKGMKRLHIAMPLLVMLLSVAVAACASVACMLGYVSISRLAQLGDVYEVTDTIREKLDDDLIGKSADDTLGEKIPDEIAAVMDQTDIEPCTAVRVYDRHRQLVYSSGDAISEFDPYTIFIKRNDSVNFETDMGELEFLKMLADHSYRKRLYREFLDIVSGGSSSGAARWLNNDEQIIGAWTTVPVYDGEFYLCTEGEVAVSNKQRLICLLIMAYGLAVTLIPILMYLITSIRAISDKLKMNRLYYMDPVTMDRNWAYFTGQADTLLNINRRALNPVKYAMVCLHIDKYQNYCVCHSTEEGEWLLSRTSHTLHDYTQKREVYGRNFNGEYGFLMKMDSREDVENRIIKIESQVRSMFPDRKIDFSAGICEITEKRGSAEDWYYCSGMARSAISDTAESRMLWFDENMKNELLWEHHVEENMQKALDNKEFQVYIQPKHNPLTGEMTGGEALIRWLSPTEGLISPGRFIPIFEKNNFIIKIDNYMISELAKLQAQWLSEGKMVVPVSVNVSRAHFADPMLAELICSLVDEYHVPHELIELEITESAFFEDKTALLSTVKKLKDMGFELSMDDFGTGYSSMNSLKELPLDVLKLDAEFFRGDQEGGRGEIVVSDAIRLAKHLNMRIVAEGVERKEQVDFLAGLDCDMIQGFYFAKPMPAADYASRLRSADPPELEDTRSAAVDHPLTPGQQEASQHI